MTQKKLQVRIAAKSGATRFYRCGLEFTGEWREFTVDAATAARLEAEQMLEVTLFSPPGGEGGQRPLQAAKPDEGAVQEPEQPAPKPAAKKTKAKTK